MYITRIVRLFIDHQRDHGEFEGRKGIKNFDTKGIDNAHLPWTSSLMSTVRGSTRAVLLTLHVKVVLSSSRVICICSKLLAFPIPLSAIVVKLDAETGPIKRVFRYAFLYRVSAGYNKGSIVWEWFRIWIWVWRWVWNLRERIRDPSCFERYTFPNFRLYI